MSFHADISDAQAHMQQGRLKPALKAAKSALRKQPKSAPAANLVAILLGRLGDHRQAAAMFRKSARLDPGFVDPRRNLAQTLILLGQPEPAATIARRLTDNDPGDAGAWYLLAQAEMAQGRLADAALAADRAVAADPGQARALLVGDEPDEPDGASEVRIASRRSSESARCTPRLVGTRL